MTKYIIRDAKTSDIDDIFNLSTLLNTINLPADRGELERVIINSEKSFSLQEIDIKERSYLFVLCDQTNRVIGTSQIFAKHGTLSSPHLYFQVEHDERYSGTLKKFFRHQTLKLCQSFDGPTEVGSLVLSNAFRHSKEKLGTILSYVRFLFMAMEPHYFARNVLAELLPPLGSQFESALWDAVGYKFTGLHYYEADMISRNNKEFIKTLFPAGEIYASLLPESAQAVIGQVGHNSRGAAHLLSKIGFRYKNRVDPFDGGPHFEAELKDISLIKDAIHGCAKSSDTANSNTGLCARFLPQRPSGDRFRAVLSAYEFNAEHKVLSVPPKVFADLNIVPSDRISIIGLGNATS